MSLTVKAALISTKKVHLEPHLAVSNWQTLVYLIFSNVSLHVRRHGTRVKVDWDRWVELISVRLKLVCLVAQSCLTLCDPMYHNPPGSSVHGVFQARILE